ncbi:MAG: hypothetical protein A3K77_00830 [Euryarchaeota archaeon RBG_13_31_8]|nr:MAG: hypothetical protein A3K77_00830 [Euryarchaeota archaeon RBG_13_31_8]
MIEKIPTEELLQDKEDSLQDIEICKKALILNIKEYSGGSVRGRLETNLKIVATIETELEKRNNLTKCST